jgi:hypothetical protein
MKLPSLNSVSPLEIILLAIFVMYLLFPVPTPSFVSPYINSNLGMAMVIIVTLYMILYTTPILGILSIFIAYELLRRSANSISRNKKVPIVKHTPSQPQKDIEMKQMNPPKVLSLEEEIVEKNAPVGKSVLSDSYIESSFKPTQDKLTGASLI